jgi:prophage DNA circulation protein
MDAVEAQAQPTEPNQEIVERFFSAYATFLQAFQPAWMAPEVQQDGAAAYQKYAQALQEMMEMDIAKQMTEAWNDYMAIIQKNLFADDLQANIREAYQEYLQSVRQAWAESDLEGINALTLTEISRSLSMTSWLAAASTGVASRLSDGSTQSMSSG